MIFLDWDDTLLCSSVLFKAGLKLDSDLTEHGDLLALCDTLATSIIAVLEAAQAHGQVHIVTNGETGWVERSAEKFVPRVVQALQKIPILSARSTYEGQFPGQPVEWKCHAFGQRLVGMYEEPCRRNILSFGDSHSERKAVQTVTKDLPDTWCKSVKFIDHPTIDQLERQLVVVLTSLPSLHAHKGDLDLRLSPSD